MAHLSSRFDRLGRWLACCLCFAVAASLLALGARAKAAVVTDVTGAVVWFDAAAISGLNDGELLGLWPDMSGNAYDLTQGTADNQPTYRDGANGLNGRPVVRFNGDPNEAPAPDPDEGDRMNTFAIPTTDDFSTLVVWTMDDLPTLGSQIPFSKFQQSAGHREWAFWWSGNLRMSTSVNGTSRNDHTYPGVLAPTTEYVVDIVTKGGTSSPLWRNGVQNDGTGTVNAVLTATAMSPISVGTSFGARTSYLKGSIAEAISFNRSLNGGERVVLQNYLAAKWGQALDPAEDFYTGDENAQGDYDSDVIGIGQAAGGKLAGSHGSGLTISELAATLDGDGEFVLAGHKTAANALVTDDIGSVPYADNRWQRVWYVDGAGDVGATLQFDFSDGGLSDPAGGSTFTLLYSPTNAFAFSVATATTVVVNGDEVAFDLASGFADGYYTLGIGTTAVIPGDVNFDGTVNIFDVNFVSAHWGETGPDGDANGDMMVDIFDVNLISANWGQSVGGGGADSVPEPAGLLVAAIALAGLCAARRKKRGGLSGDGSVQAG